MERVKKIDQNLEFGYKGISFSIFESFTVSDASYCTKKK